MSPSERYRRVKIVGRGSFGCCWLAENSAGEQCILKQIDVSKMPAKQKEEAANEVKVLSKLRHPFIINYRESYVEDGLLCIITDYAERGDLYNLIRQRRQRGGAFDEATVMRWFTQTALAIKHMHDRFILHRDLKTQNIFLAGSGQGSVKIGDFGIARVLQHTQDCARTAIGTPYYLSPEICQERPYNQKSDVWSLGCVLYELATLQHAFDSDSMRGLVMKILKGVPPPVPMAFSEELRALVSELLTKDPLKRPWIDDVLQRRVVRTVIVHLLQEVERKRAAAAAAAADITTKPGVAPGNAAGAGHPPERSPSPSAARLGGAAGGRRCSPPANRTALGAAPAETPPPRAAGRGAARAGSAAAVRGAGRASLSPSPRAQPQWARRAPARGGAQARDCSAPACRDPPGGTPDPARTAGDACEPTLAQHGPRQPSPTSQVDARSRLQDVREQYHLEKARLRQGQRPSMPSPPPPVAELAPPEPRGALQGVRDALDRRLAERRRQAEERSSQREQDRQHLKSFIEQQRKAFQGGAVAQQPGRAPAPAATPPGRESAAAPSSRAASPLGREPGGAFAGEAVESTPPRGPAEPPPTRLAPGVAARRREEVMDIPNAHRPAVSDDSSDLIMTLQEGLHVDTAAMSAGRAMVPVDDPPRPPMFLRPDGQVLTLPVSERDSLSYRVEALRVYLEQEVGLDAFLRLHRYLNAASAGGEDTRPLEVLVPPRAIEFLPLVHQLIVCEDLCFGR